MNTLLDILYFTLKNIRIKRLKYLKKYLLFDDPTSEHLYTG